MVSVKNGVKLRGVRPEVAIAITITATYLFDRGQSLVITSCTEGVHSRASLHYTGSAFDFRLPYTSKDECLKLQQELTDILGPEFDVVLEVDHFHVEFQPKQ